MKKIDVHFHLIENLHGMGSKGYLRDLGDGSGMYETGEIARIIPEGLGNKVTPEDFIKVMDRHDVEYGVALQGHYAGCQNLYVAESMQKYPSRIIGACMIDPFYRKSDLIAKHFFEDLKFKVIKMEMSNSSGIMCNHDTVDLNGAIMHRLYKYAEEYGLIFVIDIGRPGNDCYQVENLSKVISSYPTVKFVVCHLTAPQHGDQELLKKNMKMLNYPNCYFDIASLYNNTKEEYPFPEAQEDIRNAIDIVGDNKIMWGTDYPSAMRRYPYEDSYRYIEESSLFTDKEKENILYNNAKELFKGLI